MMGEVKAVILNNISEDERGIKATITMVDVIRQSANIDTEQLVKAKADILQGIGRLKNVVGAS